MARLAPLLALLVLEGALGLQSCHFLCADGQTCLSSDQVCDDYYDCPAHGGKEGGEDETVCGGGESEVAGNSVEQSPGGGPQPGVAELCLAAQASLVPDPTDCHVFYHCDSMLPQAQTCGDLMFNPRKQTCDWPRSVMQQRPECRDLASFTFRAGPRSYDTRRTRRMLSWLGRGRAPLLHLAAARPRPRRPAHEDHKGHAAQSLGGPGSVQVRDQQRPRGGKPVPVRQKVVTPAPVPQQHALMPARMKVPARPLMYLPEAPRPHVVRLDRPVAPPVASLAPVAAQPQPYLQPAAPRSYPADPGPPSCASPPRPAWCPPRLTATRPTATRPHPAAPRPHVVRLEATPPAQSPLSATDLTFLISNQIAQSIRERIPAVLSRMQAGRAAPVAKQTKVIQPPVTRVTHTVTSTSSRVGPEEPSHHYVQNSIIGKEKNEEKEEIKEEKKAEKKMEGLLSKPAPILTEETREHKPRWTVSSEDGVTVTVTRDRPRHLLGRPRAPGPRPAKRTRVLKKVRRKLTSEESTPRRVLLEPRSRMLLLEAPAEAPTINFGLSNDLEAEERFNAEERKAITLKEAFDRTINKVAGSEEDVSGSRLRDLMLEDSERRRYIDSSELRGSSE